MAEPNASGGYAAFAVVGAIFSALEHGPATGALFGSFFFLANPPTNLSLLKIALLFFFSLGFGYSAGVAVSAFGGWEKASMLVSTIVSAVGAGGVTSWSNYQNGGPVPSWIVFVFDRLPFLSKRGDQNG